MMVLAAGFALEGKIPITGTYGVFASGRPWDLMIRFQLTAEHIASRAKKLTG